MSDLLISPPGLIVLLNLLFYRKSIEFIIKGIVKLKMGRSGYFAHQMGPYSLVKNSTPIGL